MRVGGLAALLLLACGGAPPPAEPVAPSEPRAYRVPVEDDEPEDGVEIVSTRGHMEEKDVQAGIAPHTEALSECYTSRVGRRKWLGGHVAIHWDIAKTGEVTSVKLAESDLGAWPIEQCLLDVAKQATFAKPRGGDADFSLPLDFSAKGRPNVWDEDQSLRAIGGQVNALDACAEPEVALAPKANPRSKKKPKRPAGPKVDLPSDVLVTLYIGAQGKAESVGFASATSDIDPAWATCAEQLALAWRLPDPRGQVAKVSTKYRAAE